MGWRVSVLVFGLAALALPALGQEGVRIEETADPPRGAVADDTAALAAREGHATRMTYALRIKGDLAEGRTQEIRPEPLQDRQGPLPTPGPLSTGFVVVILLVLLLLWLRFGGAGALLSRAPDMQRKPTQAPEAWNISAEDQAGDPRSLIDQIAAMPDRAAALVRLLRHCLLTAATETDTRLARADTERSAFRRLPGGWRQQDGLAQILRGAELAHYGGRAVDEAQFALAIEAGRRILVARGVGHA